MKASALVESYSMRLHKAREQFESILVNATHLCDEMSHISTSSPLKSPRKLQPSPAYKQKVQVSEWQSSVQTAPISRSDGAVINDKNDKIFALEAELQLLKEQFTSNKRELDLMKDRYIHSLTHSLTHAFSRNLLTHLLNRCQQMYDHGVNNILVAENNELKKQLNQLRNELKYEKDSQGTPSSPSFYLTHKLQLFYS